MPSLCASNSTPGCQLPKDLIRRDELGARRFHRRQGFDISIPVGYRYVRQLDARCCNQFRTMEKSLSPGVVRVRNDEKVRILDKGAGYRTGGRSVGPHCCSRSETCRTSAVMTVVLAVCRLHPEI